MTTGARTAIGAALAVALAAGCSVGIDQAGSRHTAPTSKRGSFDAHGSVLLAKRYEITWGRKYALCWAKGNSPFDTPTGHVPRTPFDDVKDGAPVLVTDADGNTVGTGSLTTGHAAARHCAFGFDVVVPRGPGSYLVTVAGHPVKQFSATQMQHGLTVRLG